MRVFERGERAVGASPILNSGAWPMGQPEGLLYEKSIAVKSIWKTSLGEANLWFHGEAATICCMSRMNWHLRKRSLQPQESSGNTGADRREAAGKGLRSILKVCRRPLGANEMIVDREKSHCRSAGLPFSGKKFGVVLNGTRP